MGRGRAKAKQVKVARRLKYNTTGTDLDRLREELGVGASPSNEDDGDLYDDPYDDPYEDDTAEDLADRYADYLDDEEEAEEDEDEAVRDEAPDRDRR